MRALLLAILCVGCASTRVWDVNLTPAMAAGDNLAVCAVVIRARQMACMTASEYIIYTEMQHNPIELRPPTDPIPH